MSRPTTTTIGYDHERGRAVVFPGYMDSELAFERTMSDRSFFKSGLSNFHQIIEP